MSRPFPRRAALPDACLTLALALAFPATTLADGYGRSRGQQTVIVTSPVHAGYAQGYYPGVVTVVPGTAIVVPGQRCDTVPRRGHRFNPGSAYASGWNPRSHYTEGRLPPSHYHGAGPGPQFHGRDAGNGRARIDIRF